MRTTTIAIAAVVLLGPVSAHSDDHFDVPLELTDSSLVLVPLHVNGAGPHRFVLDTAATTTMLDARFATRLGLVAGGSIEMISAGGRFEAASGYLDDLQIGAVRIRRLAVSWARLDVIRRHDERIVGVLGQDVLSRISVTVDFVKRRVRFGQLPCGDGDIVVDVEHADGRPTIPARVTLAGQRQDGKLVIDSAANTLILFGGNSDAASESKFDTHAGSAEGARLRAVDVQIGDVALRRDAFLVRSTVDRVESGLLPASWFSRVCVDGPGRRASLTR
jgi:Aspartyl protease